MKLRKYSFKFHLSINEPAHRHLDGVRVTAWRRKKRPYTVKGTGIPISGHAYQSRREWQMLRRPTSIENMCCRIWAILHKEEYGFPSVMSFRS